MRARGAGRGVGAARPVCADGSGLEVDAPWCGGGFVVAAVVSRGWVAAHAETSSKAGRGDCRRGADPIAGCAQLVCGAARGRKIHRQRRSEPSRTDISSTAATRSSYRWIQGGNHEPDRCSSVARPPAHDWHRSDAAIVGRRPVGRAVRACAHRHSGCAQTHPRPISQTSAIDAISSSTIRAFSRTPRERASLARARPTIGSGGRSRWKVVTA